MHVEPSLLYRTRGGLIVGPLVHRPSSNKARWPWPWAWPDGRVVLADGPAINLCWDDHGHYYGADEPHELDLVAACGEPTEAPANESEPPAPTEALIAQVVRETAVSLQRFADLLLALADHAAQDPARPSVDTTGTAQQVKAETAAAQEATEWVDWYGGLCPLATGTLVEVRYRDGSTHTGMINDARRYDFEFGLRQAYWFHDRLPNDIIAYRIIKEPKHR